MTEEKKVGGLRFNSGKISFEQIPVELRVELSRVYTMGAMKYFKGNWLNGMDWSIMMDCAERHYTKWLAGMTVDEDTGCHHLAMAIWNLTGLLVYQMRGLGNDDRQLLPLDENLNWTSGPAAAMGLGLPPEKLKELEEKYRPIREAAMAAMKAAKEQVK